jgi:hypothetical protein
MFADTSEGGVVVVDFTVKECHEKRFENVVGCGWGLELYSRL